MKLLHIQNSFLYNFRVIKLTNPIEKVEHTSEAIDCKNSLNLCP
jgi:hypothetical protein